MRFCTGCGRELPQPNPKFCTGCGASLSKVSAAQAPPQAKPAQGLGVMKLVSLGVVGVIVVFAVLMLIGALVSLSVISIPGKASPSPSPSGTPSPGVSTDKAANLKEAGVTDSDGRVSIDIAGRTTNLVFNDETSGQPAGGLSVAYGMDPNTHQSLLLVIDPTDRIPPSVVILEKGTASLAGRKAGTVLFADNSVPVPLTVSERKNALIKKAVFEWLPEATEYTSGLRDAAVVAAKTLDAYGVPLGKYAEKKGLTKEEVLTPEEARAEWFNDVKDKTQGRAFFFVKDPGALFKKLEVNPASIVVDVLNLAVDANAIFSCGLPNERVTRQVVYGDLKFYGCRTLETSEQVAGLVRANVGDADERGLKLTSGSLELFSKANIGAGYGGQIASSGEAQVKVPAGSYVYQLNSPGYASEVKDTTVDQNGASISTTLEKAQAASAQTPPAQQESTPTPQATQQQAPPAEVTPSLPEPSPTPSGCSSPYEGVWTGTVRATGKVRLNARDAYGQYQYHSYSIGYGLGIAIKCDSIETDDRGVKIYLHDVTAARATDAFFGCPETCQLPVGRADEWLNLPEPGQSGGSMSVTFPNLVNVGAVGIQAGSDGKSVSIDLTSSDVPPSIGYRDESTGQPGDSFETYNVPDRVAYFSFDNDHVKIEMNKVG